MEESHRKVCETRKEQFPQVYVNLRGDLNNLMQLHMNAKKKTDELDLLEVGREFVSGREGR